MQLNISTIRHTVFFISVCFGLSACEDVITVPLDETDQKPVIEASLETNSYAQAYITLTQAYNNQSTSTKLSDAVVWLTNNAENPIEVSLQPLGDGKYRSANIINTDEGLAYTLHVQIGEQTYTATDSMRRIAPVDKITIELADPLQTRPSIMLWAHEPAGKGDYYRWICYFNHTPVLNPVLYALADDQLVDGQDIEGATIFPAEFAYRSLNVTIPEGTPVQVKQLSLTKAAYLYYVQMQTLSFGQGLFSPPPANLPGNFSNGALGFFRVSGVAWSETIPYQLTND